MEPVGREMAPVFAAVFALFFIFVTLVVTVLMAWAYCRIFSKAGYSWALGLLMLVPIANIVLPLFLAFTDWPISKELESLRQEKISAAASET